MNKTLTAILLVATTICLNAQPKSPKVEWQFDAVYYETNNWVWDDERNKTNTSNLFFYTKTVITTNKTQSWPFRFGDRVVEFGARDDGMVVWRELVKPNTNTVPIIFTNYFNYNIYATNILPEEIIVTNIARIDNEAFALRSDGGRIRVTEDGVTNIVNSLAGEFCRVRGHEWTGHIHVTLEYISGSKGCRQCKLCGVHQTLFEGWR